MNIFHQLQLLNYNQLGHRSISLLNLTKFYQINPKTIVEVGVWKGKHARLLRYLFPDADLFLVDPWKPYSSKGFPPEKASQRETFENAYRETQNIFKKDPKTTIIRQPSLKACSFFSRDIDIVFIDGDHQYSAVKSDIKAWKSKVRSGGLLAGHDYNPNKFHGVVKAVNESLRKKFIVLGDSVWATIIS